MGPGGPKWGQEDFFPTNPDLADILGRTDFDFENFYFLDFFGVPNFWLGPSLGPPTWARRGPTHLGPRPTHLGPAWAHPLGMPIPKLYGSTTTQTLKTGWIVFVAHLCRHTHVQTVIRSNLTFGRAYHTSRACCAGQG